MAGTVSDMGESINGLADYYEGMKSSLNSDVGTNSWAGYGANYQGSNPALAQQYQNMQFNLNNAVGTNSSAGYQNWKGSDPALVDQYYGQQQGVQYQANINIDNNADMQELDRHIDNTARQAVNAAAGL
jgi:hypothetical protein